MKKTVTILMLTFAVVAPAFAADDAKTIAQRLNNDWIEAFTKNNAAGLTSLYTKDAVLAPPGSAQPIIGADNIRKFFDEMLKAKLTNIAIPITEANMLDSKSLYQVGPWTAEAGNEHLGGTYTDVIVQDGSEWRYRVGAWNMLPPPQPATAAAPTTSSGSSTPNK